MQQFEPYAYVLLRIFAGFLFLWHGVQKLLGWPPAPPNSPTPPDYVLYVAGPIELLGGVLITFGLLTRPAAFLCSGLMAAAYWMAHGNDPEKLLPIQNKGELAVLYCFLFLFIFARGSGKLSLDRARENRKKH